MFFPAATTATSMQYLSIHRGIARRRQFLCLPHVKRLLFIANPRRRNSTICQGTQSVRGKGPELNSATPFQLLSFSITNSCSLPWDFSRIGDSGWGPSRGQREKLMWILNPILLRLRRSNLFIFLAQSPFERISWWFLRTNNAMMCLMRSGRGVARSDLVGPQTTLVLLLPPPPPPLAHPSGRRLRNVKLYNP